MRRRLSGLTMASIREKGNGRCALSTNLRYLQAGLEGQELRGRYAHQVGPTSRRLETDGPAPRDDHVHEARDPFSRSGHLRHGRRPTRPGAASVCATSKRHDDALALDLGEGHYRRSTRGLRRRRCLSPDMSARSTTTLATEVKGPSSATASSRTHRQSSARRASRRGKSRQRASKIERFLRQPKRASSSRAPPGITAESTETVRRSPRSSTSSTTSCRRVGVLRRRNRRVLVSAASADRPAGGDERRLRGRGRARAGRGRGHRRGDEGEAAARKEATGGDEA